MVSTYDWRLIAVGIGVALTLNPAYFSPDGGPETTYRYRADALGETTTVYGFNERGASIPDCSFPSKHLTELRTVFAFAGLALVVAAFQLPDVEDG